MYHLSLKLQNYKHIFLSNNLWIKASGVPIINKIDQSDTQAESRASECHQYLRIFLVYSSNFNHQSLSFKFLYIQ